MRKIVAVSTKQFTLTVGLLFTLTLLASYLATRSPRQMEVLTMALALFLVHVAGHLVFPLLVRRYTPGLITAVVLVLPYSLYAWHRLFAARLVAGETFPLVLLVGALLLVPLLLAARQLGK